MIISFREALNTRMGRRLSLVLEKERVIETSGGISGGDLPRRWIESKDGDDTDEDHLPPG